ncbi:MAG: HEAT repeat domain-containing protein, partial [Waddliaceae bacterium]
QEIYASDFLQVKDGIQKDCSTFCFWNLSLQEYFAAFYLAELGMYRNVMKTHKYHSHMHQAWIICAGLLGRTRPEESERERHQRVLDFFKALEEPPNDLIGRYHSQLAVCCLNACKDRGGLYGKVEEEYHVLSRFQQNIRLYLENGWDSHLDLDFSLEWKNCFAIRHPLIQKIFENGLHISRSRQKGSIKWLIDGLRGKEQPKDDSKDTYINNRTIESLREIGSGVENIVRDLANDLKIQNHHLLRKEAFSVLKGIGPAAEEAVPALIEVLRNREDLFRWDAAITLAAIGPAAEEAVPALIEALRDEVSRGEDKCANLGGIIITLGYIGYAAKEAVPALIETLRDEDKVIRNLTILALGAIGYGAADAVWDLVIVFRCGNAETKERVAHALGEIGPAAEKAVPVLIETVLRRDEDPHVIEKVKEALVRIGPAAAAAFVDALNNQDEYVRWVAARLLGNIGSAPEEAVPVLIEALRDGDEHDRGEAANALGKMGPVAEEAVPALVRALRDENQKVRLEAAHALERIGLAAKEVVSALIEALQDGGGQEREVAFTLGILAPVPKEVIPALFTVLLNASRDVDEQVRERTFYFLRQIGPEVMSTLIDSLDHQDMDVRERTADILGQIGRRAEEAAPALTIRALRDKNQKVRYKAVEALGEIGPAAKKSVPALIKALLDVKVPSYSASKMKVAVEKALEQMDYASLLEYAVGSNKKNQQKVFSIIVKKAFQNNHPLSLCEEGGLMSGGNHLLANLSEHKKQCIGQGLRKALETLRTSDWSIP